MEATPETQKKKKRVGAIVTMSVLSVFAIGLGAGLGVYLHGLANANTSTPAAVAQDSTDHSDLMATYQKVVSKGNPDFAALVQNNVFSHSDIANLSMLLMKNHNNYFTQGKGASVAALNITQKIRDSVVRNGDSYFEESISEGATALASRAYQNGDTVKYYTGSPVSGTDATSGTYKSTSVDYSLTSYFQYMGRTLDTPLIYIINDGTVRSGATKSGDPETSIVKNSDGTYKLELELSPSRSTVNYIVQMTNLSHLSKCVFYWVHLTFNLDAKLELLSTVSHEKYNVTLASLGMASDGEQTLRTEYVFDGDTKIPELQTPLAYRNGD
jgi:hypothetical protein